MSKKNRSYETLESIMDERDVRYNERFQSQQEALRIYEAQAEAWRHSANEWRGAMTDREQRFITRQEHTLLMDRVEKCDKLITAYMAGGQGMKDLWGWIVAVAVILLSAWNHFK